MGMIHIFERGGEDFHEYKKAVKMAKKAIDTICELTEDMENEYGYGERGGYSRREEREEYDERSGHSMRRYR